MTSTKAKTVKPLQRRTMRLQDLQCETLDLIRLIRLQLNRAAHDDGMSDLEFLDLIVDPLETRIRQDREISKRPPAHRPKK